MPSFLHSCMTIPHARPVEDLQFPLMRHWTLYDAMIHSPYLAVRLHTWQAKGQRRVETLLTKMGLPLRDCRRQYCALLSYHRQHVLQQELRIFQMSNLAIPST